MRQLPFFLLLLFFSASCNEQPSLIDQLTDQEQIGRGYYLFPSTLRMLNFQNDEAVNGFIKGIKKLDCYSFRPDSFDYEQVLSLSADFQEKEGYDMYLEIEGEEQKFLILGKESIDKIVILSGINDQFYLVDIVGKPNLLSIPKMINSFSAQDSTAQSGFSILFDRMKSDSDRAEQRRQARKEWEERRERERREKEGLPPLDSLPPPDSSAVSPSDSLLQ